MPVARGPRAGCTPRPVACMTRRGHQAIGDRFLRIRRLSVVTSFGAATQRDRCAGRTKGEERTPERRTLRVGRKIRSARCDAMIGPESPTHPLPPPLPARTRNRTAERALVPRTRRSGLRPHRWWRYAPGILLRGPGGDGLQREGRSRLPARLCHQTPGRHGHSMASMSGSAPAGLDVTGESSDASEGLCTRAGRGRDGCNDDATAPPPPPPARFGFAWQRVRVKSPPWAARGRP
jgi:hypothetical protein